MYVNEMNVNAAIEIPEQNPQVEKSGMTRRITSYLRWVGSILIIVSAISFMLQGNEDIVPAYRYWIGLGFTLLLCAGGMVCAYLFRETKGARIFFGLGAAFLPVQVSQVSAMIYGYWHGQAALQPAYSWLQFMNVSPTIIALDFVITAALLVLVSYASYAILARKHLSTLLYTSIAANAMLLLPIRDGDLIAAIITGLFVLLRRSELRLHQDRTMRLAEGMAARALMSLPLWIIIGRSMLHPTSHWLTIVLSATVVVYCIYDIKHYTQSSFIRYICQWLGTIAAINIWLQCAEQLGGLSNDNFSVLLPIAAVLFWLSARVQFYPRLYRFIASALVVFLSLDAMAEQQSLAPVLAIAAGILLTISGIRYREKMPFFCGNVCVVSGFIFYWEYAVNIYTAAPWVSSIVLGLLVILLASYIESKDRLIMDKTRYYFNQLRQWN